jgi:hypothetical protein
MQGRAALDGVTSGCHAAACSLEDPGGVALGLHDHEQRGTSPFRASREAAGPCVMFAKRSGCAGVLRRRARRRPGTVWRPRIRRADRSPGPAPGCVTIRDIEAEPTRLTRVASAVEEGNRTAPAGKRRARARPSTATWPLTATPPNRPDGWAEAGWSCEVACDIRHARPSVLSIPVRVSVRSIPSSNPLFRALRQVFDQHRFRCQALKQAGGA